MAVLVAPFEPVAVVNGLIYGAVLGAPLNWLGWVLAGYLSYALVSRIAGEAQRELWRGCASRWLQRLRP